MDYAHTFACHASKLKGLHAQARRDGWDEGELFELHDDEYAHLEGEDFTVPDDASIDSSRAGYDAISDDPNCMEVPRFTLYDSGCVNKLTSI